MRETATMRTNILLTPTEHRTWTAAAKAMGISLAEYIRRSVANPDESATPEEAAQLEFYAAELPLAADRIAAMFDEMIARLDKSLSPDTEREMRERVAADLAANPVTIDPSILDFGHDIGAAA